MTDWEVKRELAAEDLRIASQDEAGWYWLYYDIDGNRVSLWVTDDNS